MGSHCLIARLTGLLVTRDDTTAVIDVHGVGYLVHASTRTLAAIPSAPEITHLHVETQVREDAITLFGFIETAERDWFRLLTTVQGVGGRVALSLLSALSPSELAAAITAQDRTALTRASGVGARLAARLLTELRDKTSAAPTSTFTVAASLGPRSQTEDALSALVNLGYRRPEAQPVLARVTERLGPKAGLDAIIRESLKDLARRGSV